jgi:hypothetical protein
MDDIVRQAMAKWPNVPHCYGWLGLDARGNWYLRDDATQESGPFAAGQSASKGTLLQHEKLLAFIGRNYGVDAHGQWLFQNGPQCVYVELEATPWIWRIAADHAVTSHTGQAARAQRCFVDEDGRVYLETDTGFGLVHTLDVATAADAIEAGLWVPQDARSADLPGRFGYVMSPKSRLALSH